MELRDQDNNIVGARIAPEDRYQPRKKPVGTLSEQVSKLHETRTVDTGWGRWLIKSLSGATTEIIEGELSFLVTPGLVVIEREGPLVPFVMNMGAFESAVQIEDDEEDEE